MIEAPVLRDAVPEVDRLQARIRRLAGEKSHLQLVIRLIERLDPLPGIEAMVRTLLQSIMETIGGTNIALYYRIDDEWRFVDFAGVERTLTELDDPLVRESVASRKFLECAASAEDALIPDGKFRNAWTWVFPLEAGQELIGSIKLENVTIGSEALRDYLPVFFRHAALLLSNEIRRYKRDRAEAALRENQELLESMGEVAGVGGWAVDLPGKELRWTSEVYRIHELPPGRGVELDDAIGFVAPEARPALHSAFTGAVEHGTPWELDLPLITSQGNRRWVHVVGRAELRGDAVVRLYGSVLDITERKRAETDLRIAAAAFEAQEGMLVTDARGVILRVNRAFTEITGYRASEAVGQTPRLLKSGRHDRSFYGVMWETVRRTGSWQGELWNRRKSGEIYPQWLTITAVIGDGGAVTNYVGTLTDVTQRRAAEDEIKHLAFFDPLTRLPNRRLLLDRLRHALVSSIRHHRCGALFFIDLDDFKTLNDTLGHDQGDSFLQQVAQRLTRCLRESDTVARFGGDEFVVMLEGLGRELRGATLVAQKVSEKVRASLTETYLLAGRDYVCTASIGVTLFGKRRETVEALLKQADLAMYQAKAAGRNAVRFFDPGMQAILEEHAAMDAELRSALKYKQFVLYYQPQVDSQGRMTGVEALLRWQHPTRGVVLPDSFIPRAEETGLIRPLGQWVLDTACRQLVAWSSLPQTAALTLAVNVSPRQFRQADFVQDVASAIENTGANPCRLKLELTESLLLDDVEDAIAKMQALKSRGVGFSLDDFGTGYSSLAYLKQLPLDELKIAQAFVRDVLSDPNDAAIARTILSLGQTLGLAVIAEGVESQAQLDFLSGQGCEAFQGYLFGQPRPAEALRFD